MQPRVSTAVLNITIKSQMTVTNLIMMTFYWENQTMKKGEKK